MMEENVPENEAGAQHRNALSALPLVSSAGEESDHENNSTTTSSSEDADIVHSDGGGETMEQQQVDSDVGEEQTWKYGNANRGEMKMDDLYDENIDAENEAWVFKHRRGGVEETVKIQRPGQARQEEARMLKPRNSDAILSCPCCFEIVCMDCQQHERYSNQYRAMFVMNIGVDWKHELVYCDRTKGLADKPVTPTHRVPSEQENQQVYYSVHCSSCHTQVAALDMAEEVYHFFDCLSSA